MTSIISTSPSIFWTSLLRWLVRLLRVGLLRVRLLRLRIRLLRIRLVTLIGRLNARHSAVRVLHVDRRLIHEFIQFAPVRAAQQDTDVDSDCEEESKDGFGKLQVQGVKVCVLEVVADGDDGPHQVQGKPEDAADEEGDGGCLFMLAWTIQKNREGLITLTFELNRWEPAFAITKMAQARISRESTQYTIERALSTLM